MCIYYTVITLIITPIAMFFNLSLNSGAYLVFALAALGAGLSVQIFKIEKLPLFSRHIAFFILIYLTFIVVVLPLSEHQVRQDSILLLSVAFIVIYLLVLGAVVLIKAVSASVKNKKLKYENQFKTQ